MPSNERKSRVKVMIEFGIALASLDVTVRTGPVAELPLVGIPMLVATHT